MLDQTVNQEVNFEHYLESIDYLEDSHLITETNFYDVLYTLKEAQRTQVLYQVKDKLPELCANAQVLITVLTLLNDYQKDFLLQNLDYLASVNITIDDLIEIFKYLNESQRRSVFARFRKQIGQMLRSVDDLIDYCKL